MMHELRSIPPAPRRVRLRPLLAHRWPLAIAGLVLLLGGSLLAWLMFLQSGGKPSDQARLDRGPATIVQGVVRRVSPDVGLPRQQVAYEFPWNGAMLIGEASAPSNSVQVGQGIEVRVLVENPGINCMLGGLLFVDRAWLRPSFWLGAMAAPGALLLLAWFAGFAALRRVVVHGDATVGRVLAIEHVQRAVPEMLRVRYEFRDHSAVLRSGSHWVRLHGELGARLLRQLRAETFEPMPVLHDRRVPRWNRLILPADFLVQPMHDALPANGNA